MEKPILKPLRAFSNEYLRDNTIVHKSSYVSLREAREIPEKKEIDLLVKVIKVCEQDDQHLELRIKDLSQDSWTMIVNRMKYGEFRIGDVYRVRGVNAERKPEREVILTKSQTNFLKFNKDSRIYREL